MSRCLPFLVRKGWLLDGVGSNPDPIPHRDFIERKPEPLGKELKVLADGMSGITLRMEIQLGAVLHEHQEFFVEYGHSTAVTLRLLKPYFPKPNARVATPARALYGDSWFMGVDSAEAIHWESGKTIFPFGDVKTKTTRFPREAARASCGPASGDWSCLTTDVQMEDGTTLKMMAVGHRRGSEVHTFLSTCGLTIAGRPQAHKDDDLDWETGYVVARKCPSVLNDATQAQPRIDMTNKKRQYALALEKRFRTESFPFPLFCTILGTCITDAFYGWNYLHPERKLEWNEALRRAFFSMMHNTLDQVADGLVDSDIVFQVPANLKPFMTMNRDASSDEDVLDDDMRPHFAVAFTEVEGLECGRQNKCIVCGVKVSTCCGPCSSKNPQARFYPIHRRSSGKNCLDLHARDPDAYSGSCPRGSYRKAGDAEDRDDTGTTSRNTRSSSRKKQCGKRSRHRLATADSESEDRNAPQGQQVLSFARVVRPRHVAAALLYQHVLI